ncbi:hypothetical protein P4T38_10675 [Bacillus safensis]|uniref:hypothetical protein n=1 Tax=Bacillus safensis TaxID=561879 RepID=UPI00227F2C06|nr:hypothetical protein [Bacillus safensis]MCY7711253.1 hypothetical protein [Bacillus safensis]MCY7727268.1 hypothetical protein [Bacillus safensis]MED0883178.1 hypothetical protein [Bacillus safensis]MED0918464.1 hypothetical protein [Bacillus safensis]
MNRLSEFFQIRPNDHLIGALMWYNFLRKARVILLCGGVYIAVFGRRLPDKGAVL